VRRVVTIHSKIIGLSAVLVLAACGSCGGAPPTRVERDDRVGRQVLVPEKPGEANHRIAQPGDFVLESAQLHVLIGGPGRRPLERGTVLDLRLRGTATDQSLSHWSFALRANDRDVSLALNGMHLVERDDRPVVRVMTVAKLGQRVIHVDREIALSPVEGVLNVATSIWADEGEPIEGLRVVERLDWDGATPFAPGVGEVVDEEVHRVPWVARDGRASAVMLGYLNGAMHVRTTFQPHGAELLPGTTRVLSPQGTMTPGTALRLQAFATLAHYGVSDAVRRFGWARGKPFPEVSAYLPYVPAGTLVRVYDAAGAVQVRGRPGPDGTVIMTLPDATPGTTATPGTSKPGVMTIAATAWGHAATPPVRVTAGQAVTLRIPKGGRVHVVVRDVAGRTMPGRIRFESLDNPRKKIDLGPDHNAGGARDSVITIDGDIEVPLMPGRFLVRVTRGPEYSMVEETVEVTESFQPQVGARLELLVDPGAWIGSDFHLHSEPSPDSQVTLEDRVAGLVAEGVRFAVPTDHDHVTSLAAAIKKLGVKGFGTVSGLEVTTGEPVIGHFNAYPYPIDPSLPGNGAFQHRGLDAQQIFAGLHAVATNPLVQVNHPRMEHGIGYFDAYAYDPRTGESKPGFSTEYDVLEVWNGFDLARPDVFERVFQDWLAILSRGQRLVGAGNSDSHTVRSQWVGYPRTYVYAPEGQDVPDAVMTSLRAGRVFVSNGPFLEATIDNRGPGEIVTPTRGNVTLQVRVRAVPWMDVTTLECWVGGQLVHTEPVAPKMPKVTKATRNGPAPLPPVIRMLKAIKLPVTADTFIVVRVSGTKPMDAFFGRNAIPPVAFTNPIFVDADSDGRLPWFPPPPEPDASVPLDAAIDPPTAPVAPAPTKHTHAAGVPHTH